MKTVTRCHGNRDENALFRGKTVTVFVTSLFYQVLTLEGGACDAY
jgi:hypothetical protein